MGKVNSRKDAGLKKMAHDKLTNKFATKVGLEASKVQLYEIVWQSARLSDCVIYS